MRWIAENGQAVELQMSGRLQGEVALFWVIQTPYNVMQDVAAASESRRFKNQLDPISRFAAVFPSISQNFTVWDVPWPSSSNFVWQSHRGTWNCYAFTATTAVRICLTELIRSGVESKFVCIWLVSNLVRKFWDVPVLCFRSWVTVKMRYVLNPIDKIPSCMITSLQIKQLA